MAWPPDVSDGQIILASHINAIKNSVSQWEGPVNANTQSVVGLNNVVMAGVLDVTASFVTAPGSVIIRAQDPSSFEGGELALYDYDNTVGWKIDSASRNLRIFRGSTIVVQIDNGTAAIKMLLGGALKTLSVDGSGFVKAA